MTEQGEKLCFRLPDGTAAEAVVAEHRDDPRPAEPPLSSRLLVLEYADGARQEVRHLTTAADGPTADYDALDNEILAGLRVSRLSGPHPPAVPRLIGYDADGARPFALFEPARGRPIGAAGKILPGERTRFEGSLLTGLRRLGAAGVAHRAISPYTVHWDGSDVQFTDFSAATLIGVPRSTVGAPPWQAPEQRPGEATGIVTDRDDVWAAGRLIFFVVTGQEPSGPRLEEEPELARVLAGVFGPVDERPTVRDLLDRLGLPDPVRRPPAPDAAFQRGTDDFFTLRAHKHPGASRPGAPAPAGPGAAGTGTGTGTRTAGTGAAERPAPPAVAEPARQSPGGSWWRRRR